MSFFKWTKEITLENILKKPLPKHIAIIMDGNGRWALNRGLPRAAGHRAGVEALKKIIEFCGKINLKYITVYAFSTENWKRPKDEVDTLMNLMVEYIQKEITRLKEAGVKINPIGDIQALSPAIRKNIEFAVEETKDNDNLVLNVALNYGARAEMVRCITKISEQVKKGKISPSDINEQLISDFLYTSGQPDPDLVIRTSGEKRLSNFLLWQIAYSEIWITDVNWPDFTPQILLKAIDNYQNRNRRFGGLK